MLTRRIISTISFCLYLAAVAYLCFAKPDDMPQLPNIWFGLPSDKIAHFLMFMPFPFLGYLAFYISEMSIGRKLILMIGLLATGAIAAIGTEQVQALLQYRTFDIKDLLADSIGLSFGGVLTLIYIIVKK